MPPLPPPSFEGVLPLLLQSPSPWLAALSALLSLVIAGVVLNRNPQRFENQSFFALVFLSVLANLNAASLFFSPLAYPLLHPQYRLVLALGGFTLFALLLFVWSFPFNRRPPRLLFWPLLSAMIVNALITLFYFERFWAASFTRGLYALTLLTALGAAVRNLRQLAGPAERRGLLLIHTVLLVRFAMAGLAFAVPRELGKPDEGLLVVYLILTPPLFAALLGYGLLRFQLFDPRRLASRSLAFFLTSVLALALFLWVLSGLQAWMRALLGLEDGSLLSTTLVLAFLLTAFHPVQRGLERSLERVFNPSLVRAREAMRAYRLQTRRLLEHEALYKEIENTVSLLAPEQLLALLLRQPSPHVVGREALSRFLPVRPTTQAPIVRDPRSGLFRRAWPEVEPLLAALERSRRSHVARRHLQGLPPDVAQEAEALAFSLAIPIWRESQVAGLLLLAGPELERERLELLIELSEYLGLQWENAALYAAALESNTRLLATNGELEQSNQALEQSNLELAGTRAFLESLFEAVPAGIAVLDGQAHVVRWNRAMERLTGISKEVALGKADLMTLLPDLGLGEGEGTRQGFTRPLKRRINLETRERDVVVHMRLALFREPTGGVGGTVLILTDVTEQTQMQQALEESKRLALLGQFAAAMAHELRTPLTSIQMNIQILAGKVELPTEDMEYFDIVLTELERLNKTISEILDFARPMKLELAPLDALDLCEEVSRSLYFLLAERGVEVSLALEPGQLIRVDGERIKQVLINLLDNASQAIQEDPSRRPGGAREQEEGRIVVEGRRRSGAGGLPGLELVLSDNGRGMSSETLGRIFEPFYTTRARGTGLGLAVVKKIVESHGGELAAESEEGVGTRFRIWFPTERGAGGAGRGSGTGDTSKS
ncbi:MAG: ATP-binding protein [Myxococcota bacterium]